MKILGFVLGFILITSFAIADQQILIQVRFQEDTLYGSYHDALYFTQEEYEKLKQADIDVLKQQRIDNWIDAVSNSAPYIEPTLEELKSIETDLTEQLDEIQAKILEKEPLPIE